MAFGHYSEGRILSQPLGVEWAGWRTDTFTLHQCGWKLAVSFDHLRQYYQLMLHHPRIKLYAISNVLRLEEYLERTRALRTTQQAPPIFTVTDVGRDIEVIQVRMEMLQSPFELVDAIPQYVTEQIVRLSDLNIFATQKSQQVLIDKADMTVVEHLEAIKKLQSPKQAELRKKAQEAGGSPVPKIHLVANLVHYSE